METRVTQLERQREAIQKEIDLIRREGRVERFSDTRIRERFLQASEVARYLVRDLAEVEENFRALARDLQERQMQPGVRKGSLVGFVLDADAELRDSDQGRSFYSGRSCSRRASRTSWPTYSSRFTGFRHWANSRGSTFCSAGFRTP